MFSCCSLLLVQWCHPPHFRILSSGRRAWLVSLSPEWSLWVGALAEEFALCSWARHFTLTVPLSTQVYEWVPTNIIIGVNLRWTSIPSRAGSRNTLKPLPNGVASRRKLKTWVYLRLRLARPCVHLRWLALTCDQICTQVKASFSPFAHPTQVIASWVASFNLLLANEIQDMSPLRCLFLRLTSTWEETCESVWSPNASLYASSTCIHLRLLAGPFGQGFSPFILQKLG